MRVAVITQYFPTSAQPWAGHSAYQTLRLLAEECEVKVFYPEARYPALVKPASRVHTDLDRAYQPAGVAVEYLPYTAIPVISRPLNGFLASAALSHAVQRFQPDLILSYVIYPDGFAAVRIGQRLGLPVVLTAIGSDLNRISDPLCAMLTRSALRQAACVTTVSQDLLQTARSMGANPATSRAILNGCDLSIFHPQDRATARAALEISRDAEMILYVGRLDVRKGLMELIESGAELAARRPRMRCFLVGEGSDRPLLNAAVERFGAASWLTFVPPCRTDEVARWMAAADLVTLPSYKEGCPNVVIEALASGRPVVATDVGGIPELMDSRSGRLIPPRDVPALTSALDQVLSERWDAATLSIRHSRGWKEVAEELHELLLRIQSRNMLSSSRPG